MMMMESKKRELFVECLKWVTHLGDWSGTQIDDE
jgi:hypothetical protein